MGNLFFKEHIPYVVDALKKEVGTMVDNGHLTPYSKGSELWEEIRLDTKKFTDLVKEISELSEGEELSEAWVYVQRDKSRFVLLFIESRLNEKGDEYEDAWTSGPYSY